MDYQPQPDSWTIRVLADALDRIDPTGDYRRGKRRPRTRAEYEDVKTIRKLQNELRGLTAPRDTPGEE